MKHHTRGSRENFPEPDFLEALREDDSRGRAGQRKAENKTRQLCRQVQRALTLALGDRHGIADLFVDEVLPAPDCGRLLVRVVIPPGRPVEEALAALEHESGALRAEVCAAISRKRAPQLSFAPVEPEGGFDE